MREVEQLVMGGTGLLEKYRESFSEEITIKWQSIKMW